MTPPNRSAALLHRWMRPGTETAWPMHQIDDTSTADNVRFRPNNRRVVANKCTPHHLATPNDHVAECRTAARAHLKSP